MFRTKMPSKLETELDRAFDALSEKHTGTEEYEKALADVVTLHKLKVAEEQPTRVSNDTLITVGANLLGLMLIIKHEHVNVITSKALGFVVKPKI